MNVANVVVGIDGSDSAQRALERALELVAKDGTVHIVTAYDTPSVTEMHETYASVPKEYLDTIDLLAAPRLWVHSAMKFAERSGVNAVEHFIDDDPASAILGVATLTDADLIVVGSRGRGRMTQLLRGSVSTKIAHHSSVDFMVIH